MRKVAPFIVAVLAACAGAPQPAPPVVAVPPTPTQTSVPARTPAVAANRTGDGQLPRLIEPAPITAAEYAARRRALLDSIGDGVLVVFGAPPPAADYLPFTQLPDFRYLTGIMEPGAAYIATKKSGQVTEQLFVLDRDPAREMWEGARLGFDGAQSLTGIRAQSALRFAPVLDSLARTYKVLYTTTTAPLNTNLTADVPHAQQVLMRLREKQPELAVRSIQGPIRNLRGTKSAAELDRIRRAVYISALAHREAMRSVQPGMNEFEIRALVEYFFRRYGAEGPSYGSIVGSGPNSTTLHYQASDRFMQDGEVLLIDAAASYAGYAADVTRTFPINGRFTAEQRAIYEVVLAAQKAAAARIRRGATWAELNNAANTQIASGLAGLRLIDAPDATYKCGPYLDRQTNKQVMSDCPQVALFYFHGLGHGVGLAVHDPDISNTPGGFRPGSAVTIEPGIYVRADVFDHLPDTPENRAMIQRLRPAAQRFRNIGVRIEDVFVFDGNGVERVSAAAPQEIADIEALMREQGIGEHRRGDIVDWFRRNSGR
jgi:Xaa-Pro aminopeptidase